MQQEEATVNQKSSLKIHRQMTIEEILSLFPYKAQRLSHEITNAGLHCVGCHAAVWETLEGGMKGHGMNDEAIDRLVERLNALLEEKVDETSITLTPRAAKKYLSILEEEEKLGWALRFGDKPAGCNGFEYVLDFSKTAGPHDKVFVCKGDGYEVEIHIDERAFNRLKGSRIDYMDGLQGSGFKVDNPNVHSSCNCGSSHGY